MAQCYFALQWSGSQGEFSVDLSDMEDTVGVMSRASPSHTFAYYEYDPPSTRQSRGQGTHHPRSIACAISIQANRELRESLNDLLGEEVASRVSGVHVCLGKAELYPEPKELSESVPCLSAKQGSIVATCTHRVGSIPFTVQSVNCWPTTVDHQTADLLTIPRQFGSKATIWAHWAALVPQTNFVTWWELHPGRRRRIFPLHPSEVSSQSNVSIRFQKMADVGVQDGAGLQAAEASLTFDEAKALSALDVDYPLWRA